MTDARWSGVTDDLRQFVAERDWGQFHDPKNLSMLIGSEAGELLAVFRWVNNRDADNFAADPKHRDDVLTELADVAIGVLLLADRLGVDLPELIAQKIECNRQKYPAESWSGRAERE